MSELIIGGTSGLGLELARIMGHQESSDVHVTGRHDPNVGYATYREFDLSGDDLPARIGEFVAKLPPISTMVYAAGYYQEGRVTDLSLDEIQTMMDVGLNGLIYFTRCLLTKQGQLDQLVTITSTSQWTPRQLEPIYNAAKAGAGHFSNAIAEDGRVGKVLVAGPAGMNTDFWEGVKRDDLATMNDPADVAKEIVKLSQDEYKYRFARILRDPFRTEIVESR